MSNLRASASCPVCGYEHDFATVRDMERAWSKWMRRAKELGKLAELRRVKVKG